MRDTVAKLGKSAQTINPSCPVDLITYNSVQTDAKNSQILGINEDITIKKIRNDSNFLSGVKKLLKILKLFLPPLEFYIKLI